MKKVAKIGVAGSGKTVRIVTRIIILLLLICLVAAVLGHVFHISAKGWADMNFRSLQVRIINSPDTPLKGKIGKKNVINLQKRNIFALKRHELLMLPVKAGRFQMGSPEGELSHNSDEKRHWVTLSRDFWLGRTPVTQGQWEAVMGNNPSEFQDSDDNPVEYVSWEEAMAFCRKLNEKCKGHIPEGYEFSLPTEAQWEYACRAGTETALNNGKNLTTMYGDCPNLGEVAWYGKNSGSHTHPVGLKRPNAWGFCDMHGNVWEWCRDWHGGYGGEAIDPRGPGNGFSRVCRGGSWSARACYCRSACRFYYDPSDRYGNLGFRIALVPVK